MPKREKTDYENDLIDRLKDPEYAAAYLNAALEDEGAGSDEAFLLALRDVAAAIGVSRVAMQAGVNREKLYRRFSGAGNPKVRSLMALLKAMGLRLAVCHPADAVSSAAGRGSGVPTVDLRVGSASRP